MRFLLDHETVLEDDYIFGAISNSTSVAGILTLSPEIVDMNDGVFELLLVRKPQSLMELSDCVLALTTQDYHTPMLTFTSASHLEIDAPRRHGLDARRRAGQGTGALRRREPAQRRESHREPRHRSQRRRIKPAPATVMRLQGLFSGDRYEEYHALLSGAGRELAPAAPQQKEKRSESRQMDRHWRKFEENESPDDCVRREFREETGLELTKYRYCGIVTFVSDCWEGEYMHLFHASACRGSLRDATRAELAWIPGDTVRRPAAVGGGPAFSCASCGSIRRFFR